jgi:hypothetical protein
MFTYVNFFGVSDFAARWLCEGTDGFVWKQQKTLQCAVGVNVLKRKSFTQVGNVRCGTTDRTNKEGQVIP